MKSETRLGLPRSQSNIRNGTESPVCMSGLEGKKKCIPQNIACEDFRHQVRRSYLCFLACGAGKRSVFSFTEPPPWHRGPVLPSPPTAPGLECERTCRGNKTRPSTLPCSAQGPGGRGPAGGLTVHVHHPRGGAVLRRGHLRATLLILALLLVLVFLEEKMEQKPSHPMKCVQEGARPWRVA